MTLGAVAWTRGAVLVGGVVIGAFSGDIRFRGKRHPSPACGGTVVAGNATIGAANGGNVTITQTSAKAVINPNGIAITTSGMVNVGRGFVASSADIADSHNG